MSVTVVVDGNHARVIPREETLGSAVSRRKKLAAALRKINLVILVLIGLSAVTYRLTNPPTATLSDVMPVSLFFVILFVLLIPGMVGVIISGTVFKSVADDDVAVNRETAKSWLDEMTGVAVDDENVDKITRVIATSPLMNLEDRKANLDNKILCGDFAVPGQGNIQLYNQKNNWSVLFQPSDEAL